uniref:Rel/ankyrin family, other n=1 Tax=Rhipicephalus appendiculatus TaxID=34631 RepID=A0A131YPN0_RHIAP
MPICASYEEQNLHMAGGARLVIVEQPMKETRYRYKSESGSHGPLIGESSTQQRKTFPTVKLENYNVQLPHRIKASLVTAEDTARPHVHRITMRGRDDEDCCYVTVRENGTAMFPSMSIVFQQKKTVADILYRRKIERLQPSQEEARQLQSEAKKEAAELNLNLVRICFTAECCEDGVWKPLCVVYSNPVANSKAGKLRITKANRKSGSCKGGDEVWILCEKINKKDIQIKFFEENEETKERTWEAPATFQESDVHYQVAIVFKTPPYRDTNLQHQVAVKFQLIRKSDNDCSEPFEFIYMPCGPSEDELLAHKRRKLSHHSPEEASHYSGIMGPPGGSSASTPTFGMAPSYPASSPPPGDVLGENLSFPVSDEDMEEVLRDMLESFSPPIQSELFKEVDFNNVPVESTIMATDGDGLEASMGRLSLDSKASHHGTQGGNRHSGATSFCQSSEKDKSDHGSRLDSLDNPATVRNSKASDKLRIAMYALVCWLTKELVSKCSTKTLTKLVADMIPICDRNGNNAVHMAVRHPPYVLEPVLKILASTKQYSVCINKQNNGGQTPLHLAAQGGRHDQVMILLQRGADCALVDCAGRTILHCGVLGSLPKGTLDAILSQPQVDRNAADKEGKTALHLAVERRDSGALQALCQAGLDVNVAVDGGTRNRPLHLAVIADFVEGINILLKQDTIQVTAVNSDGMDALGIALDMKQAAIVEVLLLVQEEKKSIGLVETEQFRGESKDTETFSTSGVAKAEGGHVDIRSRVVEALECEDNATKVLGLLHEGSTQAVVDKMVALLRVSGLGNAIYNKYLQNYDDDSLRTLFVEVLGIPLN